MTEQLAPAQTYELNVLASAIGRFAIPDASTKTFRQANALTDIALQRLHESDSPVVPHTLPELLEEATLFDKNLLKQLGSGPASELMAPSLLRASRAVVATHAYTCQALLNHKVPSGLLIDPEDIAQGYGLPHLWSVAPQVVVEEAARWGKQTIHPAIPAFLEQPVSRAETEQLIQSIWSDILGISGQPNAHIHITDAPDMYHLYWAPTAESLDYTTPRTYDRSVQLSFDLPHNVAHLAHLSALDPETGVARYSDQMQQRAYFEAVAVLSEYILTQLCRDDSSSAESVEAMAQILSQDGSAATPEQLSSWIFEDRAYEFKLRAARLYSDWLIVRGASFAEAVSETSIGLGISESAAHEEAKKYLPWVGLGAVYSVGYTSLLNAGVETISTAINGNDGPITTWQQFYSQNLLSLNSTSSTGQ